jgi:gamma-glutamyl:cysteine ligase YbdK (ATP-grasp superfamily)
MTITLNCNTEKAMSQMMRFVVPLALCLSLASAVAHGQDDTPKPSRRPIVGEYPQWMKDWWNFTNAQRRQGGTLVNPKGGDLEPALNDPQIRTWRDKNGWNVRPITPQDLRSAIQMQSEVLGEMKADILRQERVINMRISDGKADFFQAKDDFKSAEAHMSVLRREKDNTEQKWDVRNFDRCPEGNPWDRCRHAKEKRSWLDDRDRELQSILSGMAKTDAKMNAVKTRMSAARTKLEKAKADQQALQNRVENYIKLNDAQKRGEPFLFMRK